MRPPTPLRLALAVPTAVALLAGGLCAPSTGATLAPAGPRAADRAAGARSVLASQVLQVPGRGAVLVELASGHRVTVSRQDPTTGAWDAPQVVLRTRGRLTCGDLEAQSSPGGVAVLVECDRPYYEDQAPFHSVALVSRDLRSFTSARLRGEAYSQPAISPDGTRAAWLAGPTGSYVEWSADGGFGAREQTTYRGDLGDEALTVDDAGTVTVIGTEAANRRYTRCGVGVHTRSLTGVRTRALVAGVAVDCGESGYENVDATTVLGGGLDRAHRFTLVRGSDGTWTRTRVAPADAPGLAHYGRHVGIPAEYLETSDRAAPLVAIGSPDRRQVFAQVYDEASQSWGSPALVTTTARDCFSSYFYLGDPRAVYVDSLRCGRRQSVLVSRDAQTWTVVDVGRRGWSVFGDSTALPDATGTTVVTPQGVQRFPGLTTGSHCDVVWAGRPGELVRLHRRGGGWPTRVQTSTGGPWTTVSTVPAPARGRCADAFADSSVVPPAIQVDGPDVSRSYQPVLVDGTWRLRRSRY